MVRRLIRILMRFLGIECEEDIDTLPTLTVGVLLALTAFLFIIKSHMMSAIESVEVSASFWAAI